MTPRRAESAAGGRCGVQGLGLNHSGGVRPAEGGTDRGDVVEFLFAGDDTGRKIQNFVDGGEVLGRPVAIDGEAVADVGKDEGRHKDWESTGW